MVETGYISCIKIGGVPIIPPLLTPEIREECEEYRRKALEIERRLQRNRIFEKCIQDLNKLETKIKDLTEPTAPDKPCVSTLEMKMALCDSNKTEMPEDVPCKQKNLNLTCETIDVAEYNGEGLKVLNHSSPEPKPKLIRSNSYTLESPSPILLAHLEREARKNSAIIDSSNPDSFLEPKSLEDYDNCESITPSTVINNDIELSQMANPLYLVETDVKVQTVTVTTPTAPDNNSKSSPIFSNLTSPKPDTNKNTDLLDPRLKEVLDKLPIECASKIMEILDRHSVEQENQLKANEELRDKILEDINEFDRSRRCDSAKTAPSLSISSSQSLYYSLTSSGDTITPKFDEAIKLVSPDLSLRTVNLKNAKNCNRRLFTDDWSEKKWAASVIGAAAKGFLVRRLLRTEKVEKIIETIKDALICAIQLHNSEIIEESDIELHRRLLQQVSAACCSFHDIFFSIPIKERMSIIACDRQRRLEKAKRPSSASSRLSNTSSRTSLRSSINSTAKV